MDIDDDEDFGFSSLDESEFAELESGEQNTTPNRSVEHTSSGSSHQVDMFGKLVANGMRARAPFVKNVKEYSPVWAPRPLRSHHTLVNSAIKSWVYPTNVPVRDYQRNIAERALLNNVLCALPTGLGKTLIAAVVMLNYYRWTTDSKIVFMAPTRPLVAQQAESCYKLVGIPRNDTAMLLGSSASPSVRDAIWQEKRVFFVTPQTLDNDLKRGAVDPKKIVLLVVDEAHRATGEYAYAKVVEFIQRFSEELRVLALSATPGSTVEAVQEVISNLSISHAEIRTETSEDVVAYVQTTQVEHFTADLTGDGLELLELFAQVLAPLLRDLNNVGAYHVRDPKAVSAFGASTAFKQFMLSPAAQNQGLASKVRAVFGVLSSLAHASSLLKYHGIRPFYDYIADWEHEQTTKPGSDKPKKPGKYAGRVIQDPNYERLKQRAQAMIFQTDTFVSHEKINLLVATLVEYFAREEVAAAKSKVIIFCQYRNSGAEILRVLSTIESVRAHLFYGQAAGKDGVEKGAVGMPQKEQKRVCAFIDWQLSNDKVLDEFKSGTYNTLIATSIGEEGLDIGQVDMIICYDASSSPVRVLQRMGRTGRFRKGRIVALLTSYERSRWDEALLKYAAIQDAICRDSSFEFKPSPRILPDAVTPEIELRAIEIPKANELPPEPVTTASAKAAARVRKKTEKKFNMPDNVTTSFTKASDLMKPSKKKRKSNQENIDPYNSKSKQDFENTDLGLLTPKQERDLKRRYAVVCSDTEKPVPRLEYDPIDCIDPAGGVVTGRMGNSENTKALASFVRKIDSGFDIEPAGSDEVPGPWDVRKVVTGEFRADAGKSESSARAKSKLLDVNFEIPSFQIIPLTQESNASSEDDVDDLFRKYGK